MDWKIIVGAILLGVSGCATQDDVPGQGGLEKYVVEHRIGVDPDQWIEMKGMAGQWDRVGLIFGYAGGDYDECVKAIAGLKRVNYAREYRCVPAN